ncbi:hypothetical protein BH09MYX1_BH09MYX1_54360 [soil metagenome]
MHFSSTTWTAVSIALGVAIGLGTTYGATRWLTQLPVDYFMHAPKRRSPIWRVVKRVLGVLLLIGGVLMLVLPGPGIIGIALGLVLIDLPIFHRWSRAAMRQPKVRAKLDSMRAGRGRDPLRFPEDEPKVDDSPHAVARAA